MKMKDIAEMAGVSIATISRVINEPEKVKPDTRRKVEEILEQTNYIANGVARGLVKSSMRTIGVLVVDVRDMYFADVTYTIERRFTDLNYNVILSNTGGDLGEKIKYLRVMLEKKVDGLVLVGSVFKERSDNKHIVAAAETVPVVLVNGYLEGDNIYSIVCDDAYGVKKAVNYLVGLGHKDIYYLNDVKTYSGLAKMEGFREGMSRHGLDVENIVEIPRSLEGGKLGILRLLSEGKKVTAVITGEDITAVGAIKALEEEGLRVPEDVAVIGYNNSILAEAASPPLTSVDNMAEAMADNAVQILYSVLQGRQASEKVTLTPNLVIRNSTETNKTVPEGAAR